MKELIGGPVSQSIDGSVRLLIGTDRPVLSVYLIGADPSSVIYSRSKVRKGGSIGVDVTMREYPIDVDPEMVMKDLEVDALDPQVKGIMIERPLPSGFHLNELMRRIPPGKDLEGLHPENYGLMGLGRYRFIPPTPLGALFVLMYYGIDLPGKDVLIIGRSPNVGRPLSQLLSLKKKWADATVTLAHSRTRELARLTKASDIIITAAGRAGLVKGNMVSDGTVLIDLGINPIPNGSIVGDVDIPSLQGRDISATPTPGGTGPVTVSSMFLNLAIASVPWNDDLLKGIHPMINEIYGKSES